MNRGNSRRTLFSLNIYVGTQEIRRTKTMKSLHFVCSHLTSILLYVFKIVLRMFSAYDIGAGISIEYLVRRHASHCFLSR